MISTNEYEAKFQPIITEWQATKFDSHGEQVLLMDGVIRLVRRDGLLCVTLLLKDGTSALDADFRHETLLMDEVKGFVLPKPKESVTNEIQAVDGDDNERKHVRQAVAWDALSENTKTAYQKAIKRLDSRGVVIEDLTDESLAVCISQLKDKDGEALSPATISLTVAAVKWYFKHIMVEDRDWTTTEKRRITIKRDAENQGNGQVDGLDWSDVDVVCRLSALDGSARGLRDAALIRLMSDCLLRISEAVAVNVEDIQDNALTVARSKNDQTGEGATLYIGDETLALIQRYCEIACISEGALFRRIRRGDHVQMQRLSVNGARDAIKAAATLAGISPDRISGHSLRVGSAVSLAKAGASVVEMQGAGRWKSPQMPAHYARAQEAERGAVARFRYGKGRR